MGLLWNSPAGNLLQSPSQKRAQSCTTTRRSAVGAQRTTTIVTAAKKGFGDGDAKGSKKQPKFTKYLDQPVKTTTDKSDDTDGWVQIPNLNASTSFASKPIKPVILETGKALCLYSVDGTIYCSDANSTAYQYPLADASLLQVKGQIAVESKLDGTVYLLATGKVVAWCPKSSNPVRQFLGTLKAKTEPIDLPVYPVRVEKDGSIFVNLTKQK